MDARVEKTMKSLKRNGFRCCYAADAREARAIVSQMIPQAASIGMGDSATLRQLGIVKQLEEEGRVIVNPASERIVSLINEGKCDAEQHRRLQRLSLMCDYYLAGTNALTEEGELINTDAAGNRVAGMFFGPTDVVLVAGVNKIVPDIAAGFNRIRNCCAPSHAKTKMRKTPCAVTGKCANCNSPERMCRVTGIIERKPAKTDISIVIVGMDLGLGWDEDWPEERKNRLYDNYAAQTKVRRPAWLDGGGQS